VGTPDPVLGEAVCACIVPTRAGPSPDLTELRTYLAARLARHKLPDELCVVDTIPRTKIGKVDRSALRDIVLSGNKARERWQRA
jgi:non-ribosomal peptide synthetase component E (peptide arylation enzyme)